LLSGFTADMTNFLSARPSSEVAVLGGLNGGAVGSATDIAVLGYNGAAGNDGSGDAVRAGMSARLVGLADGVDGLDCSGPTSEVGTLGGDPRGGVEGIGLLVRGLRVVWPPDGHSGLSSEVGTLNSSEGGSMEGGGNLAGGMEAIAVAPLGGYPRGGVEGIGLLMRGLRGVWPPDGHSGLSSEVGTLNGDPRGGMDGIGNLAGGMEAIDVAPLGGNPHGGTDGGGNLAGGMEAIWQPPQNVAVWPPPDSVAILGGAASGVLGEWRSGPSSEVTPLNGSTNGSLGGGDEAR
jgi:hypothetical protein